MAELILTEAERAAALWSDLDDAALGKLVKKRIAFLTDAAAQLERVTTVAAALLLCCAAAEQGASEIALEIEGLTQADRDFGDWKLVAMKVDAQRAGPGARTVTIGDESFDVYAERPADWSMENDYIRTLEPLNDYVFRATSWMGRTMIIVEHCGKALRLPIARALALSRLVAGR